MPKRRRLLVIAAGIIAAATTGVLYFWPRTVGEFALINETDEVAAHVSVLICGQNVQFDNIKPHESVRGSYKIGPDGHYKINVQFASGRKIQEEFGYVTSGINVKDKIVIRESDIELVEIESTSTYTAK
jgi:hypothetical protein